MSGAHSESLQQSRSSHRKKATMLFRNPLALLKSSTQVAGHYNYLSDDESSLPSFDDLPLGIHGRDGSFNFDFDNDDSDSEDDEYHDVMMGGGASSDKNLLSPNSYAQIHFHASFDDEDEEEQTIVDSPLVLPLPCTSERHLSALQPPLPSSSSRTMSPHGNRASYAASYFTCGKAATSSSRQQRGHAYEADSDTSGTVDTAEDEYDDETYTLPKTRTVCFADEHGYPLSTVHVTERDVDDDHLFHLRFIVLLLNPKKKQFEFLHLTTPREERTYVSSAIQRLSDMASDPSFTKEQYVGLCRPFKGGQEMINSLCVQDYDLERDEIVVAIPSGIKGKQIVNMAKPLLSDRHVLKTVRRKMRSGFALQSLHFAVESGEEAHTKSRDDDDDDDEESLKTTHETLTNGPNQPNVQTGSALSAEPRAMEVAKDEMEAKNLDGVIKVEHADDTGEPQSEGRDTEGPSEIGPEERFSVAEGDEFERIETSQETVECDEPSSLEKNLVDSQEADKETVETQAGNADQETHGQSEVDSCSSSKESMCRIKRLLMGISSTQGKEGGVDILKTEDAEISSTRDDDGMKQITEFIDELQEDVRSEIEAISSASDENETVQVSDDDLKTSEGNGSDIVAWFAPLENQLENALDDFRTTSFDGDALEGNQPELTSGSIEPSADGEIHAEDRPLSLSEAMDMVTSFEEKLDTSTSVESGTCRQVDADNANEIADDVVPSEKAIGGDSSEPVGEALPLALAAESEIVAPLEAETDDFEGALRGFRLSNKAALDDDDLGNDMLSASSSDVDEDEDDESGSFPVAQPASNTDHEGDEMEDVPILMDDKQAEERHNVSFTMVGSLQKSHVSFVHAQVKYIASGSFSSSCDDESHGDLRTPRSGQSQTTNDDSYVKVNVELDEASIVSTVSDRDEERKRAALFLRILNATVLIAIGFLLRTFRGKKTTKSKS